ncbi:Glyceraldehyde-3-phosphate dehydrogenase [Paenibacillus solanacearum]|uniref:Glyceraldehyde-3-phosphate dehydrogenase n=1 Tax=Paenibacillus solanacearum TaxID=2048548 RepID=A0A916K1P8_9BACL|nr:type I glyceraldehyde-3-phosphate dehydrogenase [Paenibacillus solanacearum]CAG7623032.1 Glyceraldehyde-3-phosphate dehydrogenase [Paenibacillus solanacearum]
MGNIAIHGFGRIGRTAAKAALLQNMFVPVSISDIKDIKALASLFAYDTNYGKYPGRVEAGSDRFIIDNQEIPYLNSPEALPDWEALGVDVVIDCTARATTRSGAQAHLDRGAKKVLVSAPSKSLEDCDAILLPGINLDNYDSTQHRIISMGSCTTNALAPVVKIIGERLGIKSGFFSTVHAYTNTQSLTDQPMSAMRDSWAAAENIIPSSSGAAKALKFIWPELNITGKAYRVPVRTGSIVEVNVQVEKSTSREEVNAMFRAAAESEQLRGILTVLEDEYASSRIVGERHSSIIDLPLTQVLDGQLVSVAAWYDNEMGYATRLAETALYLSRH